MSDATQGGVEASAPAPRHPASDARRTLGAAVSAMIGALLICGCTGFHPLVGGSGDSVSRQEIEPAVLAGVSGDVGGSVSAGLAADIPAYDVRRTRPCIVVGARCWRGLTAGIQFGAYRWFGAGAWWEFR